MKRVTVISVYYNRGHCVDDTINSLLIQDEEDINFIIIDDGSTDDTYKKLTAFSDPRLRIIRTENQGFVGGVILGVNEATTPYVAILGSGDVALQGRFRKQADYLDAHPRCGAVGCAHEIYREYTGTVEHVRMIPEKPYNEAMLLRNYFDQSEMMFRKNAYYEVGGYRPYFVYGQDYDLWLRINELYELASLPEILNRIFRRLESVSGNPIKYGMQQRFVQMALHCALERRAGRPDPIDTYGHMATFFRPRFRRSSSNIAKQALKCLYRNQLDQAHNLHMMLRGDSHTLYGLILDFLMIVPSSLRVFLVDVIKTIKTSIRRAKR